jgi:hypothetical protein
MARMDELTSTEFRRRYASLTKPTVVKVLGRVIGTWVPRAWVPSDQQIVRYDQQPVRAVPKVKAMTDTPRPTEPLPCAVLVDGPLGDGVLVPGAAYRVDEVREHWEPTGVEGKAPRVSTVIRFVPLSPDPAGLDVGETCSICGALNPDEHGAGCSRAATRPAGPEKKP